jgi:hypothetical protein
MIRFTRNQFYKMFALLGLPFGCLGMIGGMIYFVLAIFLVIDSLDLMARRQSAKQLD